MKTDPPHTFREFMAPMTAADKQAISLAIRGSFGAPPQRSLSIRIVILAVWIGGAYAVKLATDSWWASGIAFGAMTLFGLLAFKGRRDTQLRFNRAVRVGEVKVIEGIVEDYGVDVIPPKNQGIGSVGYYMVVSGQKFKVKHQHLDGLRYGARVQLRFQMPEEVLVLVQVQNYGDHGLDWTAPVEPAIETEEVMGEKEKQLLLRIAKISRNRLLLIYGVILIFLLGLCVLSYLIVGMWLGVVLALIFVSLIRQFPKTIGSPIPSLRLQLPSDHKYILEGVLVMHEVQMDAKTGRPMQHFWTVGTHRIPILLGYCFIAEPGDRVRLYRNRPDLPPYRIERIQQRHVDWT